MTHYIRHLECSRSAATYPPDQLYNLSPGSGAPLFVRYRLEDIKLRLKSSQLAARIPCMWRYRELLPVAIEEEIVSLGEGWTPLIRLANLAKRYGFGNLFVKNEAHNPTGSFKDRGLSAAVTMARKLGARKLCIPTAGNAGGGTGCLWGQGRTGSLCLHAC